MRAEQPLLTLLILILSTSTISATYLLTSNRRYSATSSSIPAVSVSPRDITRQVEIGQTFTVNVTITNVNDLYVWQAGMTFNATILEAVNFTEGPFLQDSGDTLWVDGTINNTAGIIHYHACTLTGNVTGVSGNGTLGTVTFKVKNYGNSTLQLTDVILLDSTLTDIDKTIVDGTVFVTILSDITGPDGVPDGMVDMWDFGFIALAYGKTSADPDWDDYKIADIRGPENPPGSGLYPPDGVVDISDLGYCGLQYGESIYN